MNADDLIQRLSHLETAVLNLEALNASTSSTLTALNACTRDLSPVLTAGPSVTQADVDAAIAQETYVVLPDGRTTVCQLTLDNGFTVEGMSACVSSENFNIADGRRAARDRALDCVWMLLGFRLKEKLAGQG